MCELALDLAIEANHTLFSVQLSVMMEKLKRKRALVVCAELSVYMRFLWLSQEYFFGFVVDLSIDFFLFSFGSRHARVL